MYEELPKLDHVYINVGAGTPHRVSMLKHWVVLAEFGPHHHVVATRTTTLQHSKVFDFLGAFQSVEYSVSNLHQQRWV